MLDEISEKEITTREGLERIGYLLNELNLAFLMYDFIDPFFKKEEVTDYFHRLFEELKSLSNISSLLAAYPSPDKLKDDIETTLTTINDIYYKSENFKITDEEINEMKNLLNTLLDVTFEEIVNRMCGD